MKIVKKSVSESISICGTQAALAKKAGITQGAVGKYLRGEAFPRGETANALSKAVGGKLKPSDFAPHIFTQEYQPLINGLFIERRSIDKHIKTSPD